MRSWNVFNGSFNFDFSNGDVVHGGTNDLVLLSVLLSVVESDSDWVVARLDERIESSG
jgi:hypothetical protein